VDRDRVTVISIQIPGFGELELAHLVLDYNGTLALDGRLLPGVAGALFDLAPSLRIHVVTADTFGFAKAELAGLPVELLIIAAEGQVEAKLRYVSELGANTVVAIGNGRNDRKMLRAAALGIALIQREGGAADALACADPISMSILDALDLLRNPARVFATLR
jgi:soluble P-type ATPase